MVPGDYNHAVDGELVYVPEADCCDPSCGCDRGFAGVASARATTTAMVVDRPDLTEDDVSIALIDGLTRQGWLEDGWGEVNEELFEQYWAMLELITLNFAPGTIVERSGNEVRQRPITGLRDAA